MTSPPLPLLTGAKESAPPVLSMPPIAACAACIQEDFTPDAAVAAILPLTETVLPDIQRR